MSVARFISAILFLPCSINISGAESDSLSVHETDIFQNPAARFFEYAEAHSEAFVGYGSSRFGEHRILQNGEGTKAWNAEAHSWMLLDRELRIWGRAAYKNSIQKSMCWNETSDFNLLYPYVMADSVGGDMKGQRYEFGGGLAAEKGRFTLGLQLDYRAQIEYRDRDPRPRNIVSDLNFNLGSTYRIMDNYRIGVSVGARKYSQNNDVDFYSQLGNPYIYTMTGLGNTSARFDASRTSVDYSGSGYTAALQFFGTQPSGWRINAVYTNLQTVRHLKSDADIPLTELDDGRMKISASYFHKSGNIRVGGALQADCANRKGTENLFDSGNGISYEKIGSRKPYSEKHGNGKASAFLEIAPDGAILFRFRPFYGYGRTKMTHTDNNRRMEYAVKSMGADAEIVLSAGGSLWTLSGGYAYCPAKGYGLSLDGLTRSESMKEMYEHNYRTLSDTHSKAHCRLRATFPCAGRISLYGEVKCQYVFYDGFSDANNGLDIRLGVIF